MATADTGHFCSCSSFRSFRGRGTAWASSSLSWRGVWCSRCWSRCDRALDAHLAGGAVDHVDEQQQAAASLSRPCRHYSCFGCYDASPARTHQKCAYVLC